MARLTLSRASVLLGLTLSLAACSDDAEERVEPGADSGVDASTKPDAAVGDAGFDLDASGDAAVLPPLQACVDRPGALTAPSRELPCELLPPGFGR